MKVGVQNAGGVATQWAQITPLYFSTTVAIVSTVFCVIASLTFSTQFFPTTAAQKLMPINVVKVELKYYAIATTTITTSTLFKVGKRQL